VRIRRKARADLGRIGGGRVEREGGDGLADSLPWASCPHESASMIWRMKFECEASWCVFGGKGHSANVAGIGRFYQALARLLREAKAHGEKAVRYFARREREGEADPTAAEKKPRRQQKKYTPQRIVNPR